MMSGLFFGSFLPVLLCTLFLCRQGQRNNRPYSCSYSWKSENGCGGSSTPAPVNKSAADAAAAAAALLFDPQERVFNQLANKYIDENTFDFRTTLTPVAQIPLTGATTYAGKVALDLDASSFSSSEDEFVGNASIRTDFGVGNVTGSFSNLVNEDDEILTGSLNLSGGAINRRASNIGAPTSGSAGSGGITANWAGTLTDPDGDAFAFNGNLAGEFLGPNREGLVGVMSGGVNAPGGINGAPVVGIFVTER